MMNILLLKRILFGLVVLGLIVPGGLIFRHYQVDLSQARQRVASGAKQIETACGPIQYAEFGTGAPMLMVHGAGGGYDQGVYFARIIGENYRWIVPSRFGYLGTKAPDNASSELQADAHACLLDALGIDRVGVVGISGGGSSALLFAQRHPQRTNSLAMIDAVSHAIPPRPALLSSVFSLFTNDFVFWSLLHLTPEGMLAMLGVPEEDQKILPPENLLQAFAFLETILPMGARVEGQNLEQRMSEYDTSQIKQIAAPTLVLHARNDTLVAYDQGEFTTKMVPGARMISMEKGGHLALMFDINADALGNLRAFIDQHNP
jgi:2-hydroxy-6-oxonona-2,4-dienedioate hydrolase